MKVFYFLPRILSILLIAFISVFALDVFDQPRWFLALLMHLIPSFIVAALTIFSWRWGRVGGVLFLILGLLFAVLTRLEGYFISLPLVAIGVLYIISDIYKNKKMRRKNS